MYIDRYIYTVCEPPLWDTNTMYPWECFKVVDIPSQANKYIYMRQLKWQGLCLMICISLMESDVKLLKPTLHMLSHVHIYMKTHWLKQAKFDENCFVRYKKKYILRWRIYVFFALPLQTINNPYNEINNDINDKKSRTHISRDKLRDSI